MIRAKFRSYVDELQDRICAAVERIDGRSRFHQDEWQRPGGGGGRTRVIADGDVFEKGGVNISEVFGRLPAGALGGRQAADAPFYACGLSLVIHPRNPYVPTVHMNVRIFEILNDAGDVVDRWFGGGADLTPYYLFEEDVRHFHAQMRDACAVIDSALYLEFKRTCDEYFVNRHRGGEARGVGGIFFDELRESPGRPITEWFTLVRATGDAFLPAYLTIVERRRAMPYGRREIDWQEIRRGRYAEFNLVHDRGTVFGLRTSGRIESILMSLPPRAQWRYDHRPEPGSPEAVLLAALAPRDWLADMREVVHG
jgi:coproporphyrinogen III oxidase